VTHSKSSGVSRLCNGWAIELLFEKTMDIHLSFEGYVWSLVWSFGWFENFGIYLQSPGHIVVVFIEGQPSADRAALG
jgi:hypothetical protein